MATQRQIIISREDHARLENLFFSGLAAAFSDKPYLQSLRGELSIAKIVAPEKIPPDVVTMNSTVRVRALRSKEVETYTLVYPEDAAIAEGKLSVLAPIGTAILGYRVGDRIEWKVPRGVIRFKIEELVFQPERDRGGVDKQCRISVLMPGIGEIATTARDACPWAAVAQAARRAQRKVLTELQRPRSKRARRRRDRCPDSDTPDR